MDFLRQYAVSLVTAAMICGILSGIAAGSVFAKPLHLLCGIALAVTAIRPLVTLDLPALTDFSQICLESGEALSRQGQEMSQEAMEGIIISSYEAYILDKAAQLGATIAATVQIDRDQLPASAALQGRITPYVKQRLETILENDLGIAKENQLWTN